MPGKAGISEQKAWPRGSRAAKSPPVGNSCRAPLPWRLAPASKQRAIADDWIFRRLQASWRINNKNEAAALEPMRHFLYADGPGMAASPDVTNVVAAAEALNVREYNLFNVAYAWWFGRVAGEKEVERPFMRYLMTEQAPVWVRQFAREVLERKREGRLDPRQYGLPPAPPPLPTSGLELFLRGVVFALWVLIVAIILIGVIG
jgi:hypothetical protein